jgi:hypothetical protein
VHWYRKVGGEWKFAGLAPEIRWCEYDFDKVFEEGRGAFGEDEEEKGEKEKDVKEGKKEAGGILAAAPAA